MEEIKLLPNCIVCNKSYNVKNTGGFSVRGQYVCPECEAKILKIQASDEEYQEYINIIKKVWFKAQ